MMKQTLSATQELKIGIGQLLVVEAFDFFSVGDLTDFEIDGCIPNDGGSSDWYFIQPLST